MSSFIMNYSKKNALDTVSYLDLIVINYFYQHDCHTSEKKISVTHSLQKCPNLMSKCYKKIWNKNYLRCIMMKFSFSVNDWLLTNWEHFVASSAINGVTLF